jgi:hypothetical protein
MGINIKDIQNLINSSPCHYTADVYCKNCEERTPIICEDFFHPNCTDNVFSFDWRNNDTASVVCANYHCQEGIFKSTLQFRNEKQGLFKANKTILEGWKVDEQQCSYCGKIVDIKTDGKLSVIQPKEGKDYDRKKAIANINARKYKAHTKVAQDFFDSIIKTDILIFDSNIWMGAQYDPFFSVFNSYLKLNKLTFQMPGWQFDEISNTKKKANNNTPTLIAINRIETLQIHGFLTIQDLTKDAAPDIYADPLLVNLITSQLAAGKSIAFISDDTELRVRIRGLTKKNSERLLLAPGRDIIPSCISYCHAYSIPHSNQKGDQYPYENIDIHGKEWVVDLPES